MRTAYWHCLDLDASRWDQVGRWLEELTEMLASPPAMAEVAFCRLAASAAEIAEAVLQSPVTASEPFRATVMLLRQKVAPLGRCMPMMVCCRPDSIPARTARCESLLAQWGYCCLGLSVLYKLDNKWILWHEALHLFGVNDCYDNDNPQGPTICELPHCLMQYAPSDATIGAEPFLCSRTIKALRGRGT